MPRRSVETAVLSSPSSPGDSLVSDEVARLLAENAALKTQNAALQADLERLNAALAHQQQAADDLELLRNAILNNVSHEMKTPLLHVKAAVSNLKEEFGENRLIDYATSATTRLEGIIRNITLLADSLNIRPTPAPLRDAVDQALRSLRRSWEHKDHVERVKVQVEGDLAPVLIDPQAIGIALQLLLDNALKFSKDDVMIRLKRVRQGVRVEVCDTGIGIAEDQLTRIFEPFYQVESGTTRRFSGMGIGLAIVRIILERHEVAIAVKSKPNKGSTFSFVLPAAPRF